MGYILAESVKVEDGKMYICKERIHEIVGQYDLKSCTDWVD